MTIDDKTCDLARKPKRRGGLIRQMSDRQSDVRELLSALRNLQDKRVEEALAGNLGYDDDQITVVVLSILDNTPDPDREILVDDLIWAGAFLDNLDTQGFRISRKKKLKKQKNDRRN